MASRKSERENEDGERAETIKQNRGPLVTWQQYPYAITTVIATSS